MLFRIVLVLFSLITFSLITASSAFAAVEPNRPWGLNDVSILLPLTEPSAMENLLQPGSSLARGELLPRKFFDELPYFLPGDFNETFARLRVVAIRIDPCFPGGDTPPEACKRQIRFVWQPLVNKTDGGVWTLDGTLHTFHELTASEFESFVRELAQIRATSQSLAVSLPLQVHPVIAREGLGGILHTRLKSLLLSWAGESNLTRFTFMTNHGAGNVWDFGGFDIDRSSNPERLLPMAIPRLSDGGKPVMLQRFVNNPFPRRAHFTSGMTPEPASPENLNFLVRNSRAILPERDEKEILRGATAAARFENPKIHSPETLDCVSCHVAQNARLFADRQFPWLAIRERLRFEDPYISRLYPVHSPNPFPEFTVNLRAFGYFETFPAISQRVIQESCEVAEALSKVAL